MTDEGKAAAARKRWVEAAKAIADDIGAKVDCPACGEAHLTVRDSEPQNGKKERALVCEKCGARVFIRMDV